MKKKMKYVYIPVTLIITLFLLAACGTIGTPNETSGQRVLENTSKCVVINFTKINATTGEILGTQLYNMQYEADLDCGANSSRKSGINRGTLTFTQTEKGWQGMDGNIY